MNISAPIHGHWLKIYPVILAGLVAGTLDASAACARYFLQTGRSPAGVFKFIASGVFGNAAFEGGAQMVFAGVGFHYLIAIGWTVGYALLRSRLGRVPFNSYLSGTAWAVVIWCAMTFVVLPLSHAPKTPITTQGAAIAILILVLCVGLPISLILDFFNTRLERRKAGRPKILASGSMIVLLATPMLGAAPGGEPDHRVPVVVELFTSEGCSSCPPADEALARLAVNPPPGIRVIPLAFHVDYWNGRGWRDRWSNHEWTKRQLDYQRRFKSASAYTPQMVVDGRAELVGSNETLARQKILEAAGLSRIKLSLIQQGGTVHIKGQEMPAPAILSVFLLQERGESEVLRGESKGKHLNHTALVVSCQDLGNLPKDRSWERICKLPKNLHGERVVALLHESSRGQIVGVGDLALLEPDAKLK